MNGLQNRGFRMTTEYLDATGAKHIVDCCKELVEESQPDLSGYALADHNHDGEYQPVGDYVTETELTAKDLADKPYVDNAIATALTDGEVDLSNYYTKAQTYNKEEVNAKIPTVPTNVGAFVNDSGYLTEHQSLAGYATETYVTEKIATDLSGYYTKAEVDALIASIGGGGTASYTITVSNDGNGTASADVTSATEGTIVTLTNIPNDGYAFKEWQVVSGAVTIMDNKFTMPASNVEVKAVFEAVASVTPVATSISGSTSLKLGFTRTYIVKDADSSSFTDVTGTFVLESADFDPDNTTNIVTEITGNTIQLFYENEDLIGYSAILKWTDATGKYSPCELEISLVDSF